MIYRALLFFIITTFLLPASAQEIRRALVPAEVKGEAADAVLALGQEVMKGNFLYSLEQMYPRWKERAARRVGGMEALTKRLESVPEEMQRKGISILDFQVGTPESPYEVNATIMKGAQRSVHFSEYLVLVPTTTIYRAIDPNGGVVKRLESKSFQVAVSKKGSGKWQFIDGSSMSFKDLRDLFPFLPSEEVQLKLPPTGMKEL